MSNGFFIYTIKSGIPLAQKVCDALGQQLEGKFELGRLETHDRHHDGEWVPRVMDHVEGKDAFVMAPLCSGNDVYDMCAIMDALYLADADRIIAIPTYLYGQRQERKMESGVAVTAKLTIDILNVRRPTKILFIDLHAEPSLHFVNPPTVPLEIYAAHTLIPYIKEHYDTRNMVVCAADEGGVKRSRAIGKFLDIKEPAAMCHKDRPRAGEVSPDPIIQGDVEGKDVIIPEDLISTGGTLREVSKVLKKRGA